MANDFKKYPYQDYNSLNLDWLVDKIKELVKSIADTLGVANNALRKAISASADAENAYNLADTANTAAGNAQNRADDAYTLAGNSNTAAGNAQNRADDAYTLAGNANTAAGNAQNRADDAYTLANDAASILSSYVDDSVTGVTLPTSTRKTLNTITIPSAGTWLIYVHVDFPHNATGVRRVELSDTNNGSAFNYAGRFNATAVSGSSLQTTITGLYIASGFTANKKVYIVGTQTSSSSMNVSCYYCAQKLDD